MGLNLGVMSAAVVLDDSDYRKKLSGLEGASESAFKRIAQLAAGYLTARALFGFVQGAMAEFSKLEEGNNKLKYTYTSLGAEATRVAETIATTYGLARQTATNAIADVGDLLTGLGFQQAEALSFARQVTERGIDIASYKGLDQTETIRRMTVALTGETESLKSMGIVIRQGSEEFQNQVQTVMNAAGATETMAKAQVILQEIMKQTANAAGDYLRPDAPRTYAQEISDLKEAIKQFKAEIGTQVQPFTQETVVKARELLTWYNELTPATKQLLAASAELGAAFALIFKYGLLSSANKAVGALSGAMSGGLFSGVKAQAEANVVTTAENLKRAEYAKTDAFREAKAAAQSVRIARLAIQEQEAAVLTAKIQMQEATKTGNIEDVLAAKKQLATATQSLTNAQLAESAATQQLAAKHSLARTANMQHAVAATACAKANTANAAASTVAGRAQVILAASLTKVRAAATAFATALGPIGAAIIALSGAYMAFQYICEKNRNILEGQVEAASRNTQAAKEMADAHAKERAEATASMERLQELSKYDRLNNAEKSEAEKLITVLSQKYGDLGISIDSVTGKLNLNSGAWKRLNEAQRKEVVQDVGGQVRSLMTEAAAMQNNLRNELSSFWKNSVAASAVAGIANLFGSDEQTEGDFAYRVKNSDRQQELDQITKRTDLQEQIRGLEAMRNSLTEEGNKEQAGQVDALIKKMQELKKKQDEFNAAVEVGKKKNGENYSKSGIGQTEAAQKARQISESQRNAYEKVGDLEWNITFNSASAEKQTEMLSDKMQKIFSQQSGKYATIENFKNADRSTMTKQELEDLEKIIRLDEQRRKISEVNAKAFEDEKASYDKFLAGRRKSAEDKAVEKQIEEARKSGDTEGANRIMRDQLAQAQESARNMQQQYEQAVRDAQSDKVMTEKEKARIAELRSRMQESFADQDKWQGRVDGIESNEKKQAESSKSIGAWSIAALEAMLGGTSQPEKETARNTRLTVNLLRAVKNNTSQKTETTYE